MKKKELIFLVLLLAVAAFFRLWHLNLTQFITYDQARDFLIIKRMFFDHKLTLVGPTVLIPGVYLPPFYYYLLAPFLILFRFQPLGADFFTAILGVGAVFLFYLLGREIFGKLPAALGALLFAVLPTVVSFSRHAWNPNTTHFWALAVIFCLYKFWQKEKWLWFYMSCLLFGLSLNFHFSLLAMAPVILLVFFLGLKKKGNFLPKFIISLFFFSIFLSPLLIFELRHHFPITSNIFHFLTAKENGSDPLFFRFWLFLKDIFRAPWFLFNGHLLKGVESVNPSSIILTDKLPLFKMKASWGEIFYQGWNFLVVLFLLAGAALTLINKKIIKNKKGFYLILIWFLFGVGLRFLVPPKSFYYYQYNFLFPAILFFAVNLFYLLGRKKWGLILAFLLFLPVFVFSFFNFFRLPQSPRSESFFLPAVKIIAEDFLGSNPTSYVVASNNKDQNRWDHNGLEYRYFLEAYFKLPLSDWEAKDYQQAKVLYLIDEGDLKEPLNLGGMEMDSFAPQKIEKTWITENEQKIYKMSK